MISDVKLFFQNFKSLAICEGISSPPIQNFRKALIHSISGSDHSGTLGGYNTNVTKEMDFRNAIIAASSRGSRSPRAQSGAPRARHMKFHRPLAAFCWSPREARGCAPEGGRAPRDHSAAPGTLYKKSPKAIGLWYKFAIGDRGNSYGETSFPEHATAFGHR